ncbi:MAG TPA: hypothetical protein VGQ09_09855 [Chitinophagaceae bacterium]|jgi:hypothetical protein|nr:hypothetical protein [Chitinophagaceae bacterium]
MKILILIGVLTAGSIFLLPKQKNIAGTWVLETEGKKCETTILRIQMAEGYFTGRVDMPEQQVYDQPVLIQQKKDSIKILLDKNGSCFIEAAVNDSTLIGKSVVSDKAQSVKFYRAKK